jgi:hypothetical protein
MPAARMGTPSISPARPAAQATPTAVAMRMVAVTAVVVATVVVAAKGITSSAELHWQFTPGDDNDACP